MNTSDNGVFLWITYEVMQNLGLDCAEIFGSVGLPDEPPDPQQRRDNAFQARFWRAAERVSGEPDIGLYVGQHMPPVRGQVLEYLFLSSPTFGEGLERTIAYQRLMTDALQFDLQRDGDTARLTGLEHPVRHYLEFALCIIMGLLRHVTDGEFRAREIHLTYSEGADPEAYRRILGCPVKLGMPEGAMYFDAEQLARVSPAAEPGLLAVHEQVASERLADLERQSLVSRLEGALGGLLEQGEATLAAVAGQLGLSPRQLRAELSQADTSFNRVVAHYRERLARRLLSRTDESIDQIVYLTGFSEPSAFTRAFKRWTGETPTAYRERKRQPRPQ